MKKKIKKWFRSLSTAQAVWFYLGFLSVFVVTVLHNPTQGYYRKYLSNESRENDHQKIERLVAEGWERNYVWKGYHKSILVWRMPKYWSVDPRGWKSRASFALESLGSYLAVTGTIVLLCGTMVFLIGIRKE